jgi:hypothetical protein
LKASIRRFGFRQPILARKDGQIVAGHERVEASKELGLKEIPVIWIENLSEAEIRAYVIADNKIALLAGWDKEKLVNELQFLVELGFELEPIGFDAPEVDLLLESVGESQHDSSLEDAAPPLILDRPAITQPGDIWLLGTKDRPRHRLLCGDARDSRSYLSLLGLEQPAMVLTDPPFNEKVNNVSGKGRIRHREFAMASGEMSETEFILFLRQFLAAALQASAANALLYVFMDWRHAFELLTAARALNLVTINLCVWNKSNGGMGSLYRYYVSTATLTGNGPGGIRIPAGNFESLVIDKLRAFFADAAALLDAVDDGSDSGSGRTLFVQRGRQIADELGSSTADGLKAMLMTLLCRVAIKTDRIEIGIYRSRLAALLANESTITELRIQKFDRNSQDVFTLQVPAQLKRVGREIRMLVDNSSDSASADPSLLRIIARAHDIQSRLGQNTKLTVHDVARDERVSAAYIYNLLRLPWLAPDITTAIINGRQPRQLNAKSLMRQASRLPADWADQRAQLGFRN